MENINLFYPTILKEEWMDMFDQVFDTRWIGQGPMVDRFEQAFASKFGFKHCLAVNSGTASLDLAYHLLGLKLGDEVLTTVFTCTATNIPLVHAGVNIKFVDIDDNLLISYEDIKRKITKKTKAIVVVNLGGLRVDERIYDLAKSMNIPVVVDACQSLGIKEDRGDFICYSFQAIKHFTTGDGGMLVVRDKEMYERAKKLRWFGIDREAKRKRGWRSVVKHKTAMEIEEPGYKYHMNDIAASMGIVGLRFSDEILRFRKKLCEIYANNLNGYKMVYGGSCWLFAIIVDNRKELIEHLRSMSIECDPVQLRNDEFKVFGGKRQDLPVMNDLEKKYLYLPLHYRMTKSNVYYICGVLNSWMKNYETRKNSN